MIFRSDESISVKSIDLVWRSFFVNHTISKEFSNVELKTFLPQDMNVIVTQLLLHVAGEQIKIIKYPADWWQSFKERWYPNWAKKRWPVCYTVFDIEILYPKIDIRKDAHPRLAIFKNPPWTAGDK